MTGLRDQWSRPCLLVRDSLTSLTMTAPAQSEPLFTVLLLSLSASSSSVRSCAVCSFPHRQTVCPPWHRSMPCVFGVLAVGYVLLPYVGYALSVLLMILTIFCLRWGCALSFLWSTCCAWHALSRSSRGLHSFLHALFVESSCLCLFSNCTCRFPGSRFRTLWPTLLWLCVGGSLRLLVRQRLCLSELSGRKSFKALSALAWPAVKAFLSLRSVEFVDDLL